MENEIELNPVMDLDTALIILKVFTYCEAPLPFNIKDRINSFLDNYQKSNIKDRKKFTKAINESDRTDSLLLESNLWNIDLIIAIQLQYEELLR